MFENHDAKGCDNPDCPLHGKGGIFDQIKEHLGTDNVKFITGEGAGSLGEAIAGLLGGSAAEKTRSELRKKYIGVLETVLQLEGDRAKREKHDGDIVRQALMEALTHVLAGVMAAYTTDFASDDYIKVKQLLSGHYQKALQGTVHETVSAVLLIRGLEKQIQKDEQQRESAFQKAARNQAENN